MNKRNDCFDVTLTFVIFVSTFTLGSFTHKYIEVTGLGKLSLAAFLFSIASSSIFLKKKPSFSISLRSFLESSSFLFLFFILLYFGISNRLISILNPLHIDQTSSIHRDVVFHISLIRSIQNFGFPSTGLHGIVHLGYHSLSHYVDSAWLFFANIDPLVGYGLLSFFKIATFFSISFNILSNKLSGLSRYLLLSVLLPLVFFNWKMIGSESMWFSTILVFIFLYIWVEKKESYNLKKFILFLFICFGKVSFGLTLITYVGWSKILNMKFRLNELFYLCCSFIFLLWLRFFFWEKPKKPILAITKKELFSSISFSGRGEDWNTFILYYSISMIILILVFNRHYVKRYIAYLFSYFSILLFLSVSLTEKAIFGAGTYFIICLGIIIIFNEIFYFLRGFSAYQERNRYSSKYVAMVFSLLCIFVMRSIPNPFYEHRQRVSRLDILKNSFRDISIEELKSNEFKALKEYINIHNPEYLYASKETIKELTNSSLNSYKKFGGMYLFANLGVPFVNAVPAGHNDYGLIVYRGINPNILLAEICNVENISRVVEILSKKEISTDVSLCKEYINGKRISEF